MRITGSNVGFLQGSSEMDLSLIFINEIVAETYWHMLIRIISCLFNQIWLSFLINSFDKGRCFKWKSLQKSFSFNVLALEKKNQLWAHDFLLKVDEFGVELTAEADRISEKIALNQVKSVKQGFPLEKYKEILLILVKEGSNYELQCLSCVDCYARGRKNKLTEAERYFCSTIFTGWLNVCFLG